MGKMITKAALFVLIILVCINACGCAKTASGGNETAQVHQIDGNSADDNIPATSEIRHITDTLSENLSIDADVVFPQLDTYSSYRMGKVSVTQEAGAALFFPNDDSEKTSAPQDQWGRQYAEGDYSITTERGNVFSKVEQSISANTAKWQQSLEIEELLRIYAETHPDKTEEPAFFMSNNDAVDMGIKVLEDCGIPFTPVLETCVGLDHEQLMSWQQILLADVNSYYNAFGKALVLSELTADDDSIFLCFCFSYNGIPILNAKEPSITFADNVFPPTSMRAEMLITPLGIQHFDLYPAYTVAAVQNMGPIISADNAISKVKDIFDSVILSVHYKIVSVYLEYIPLESNGITVLTPYWCVEMCHENIREDGTTYWSEHTEAERINAFTGENLKYGG